MSFAVIGNHSLQPGQWVDFLDKKEKRIKEFSGPYLVISREDTVFKTSVCFLMTVEGQLVNYFSRERILKLKYLPLGYKLVAYSDEAILKKLKKEREVIEKKALAHVKAVAQFSDFGKVYDPENRGKLLSWSEVRERYRVSRAE